MGIKLTKVAAALGFAAVVAAPQVFAAPAFSLGGYTGPIVIKFQNWESFNAGFNVGSENFGILKITSILNNVGGTLWSDGTGGAEITGLFRDLIISNVGAPGPIVNAQATGGLLDLYINPVGTFAAAGGPTQGTAGYSLGCATTDTIACYNGINAAGGAALATGAHMLALEWATGVVATADTLDANLIGGTFPGTGTAAGFMNVIGGDYAATFDTNGQVGIGGQIRDLFAQNDFCDNSAPACNGGGGPIGNWQLLSDDPVRGRVVPEPGTLGLLGIALLGLAGLRRKKSA